MYKITGFTNIFSGYTFREAVEQHPDGSIRIIQPKNSGMLDEAPLVKTFANYQKYLLQNDDILITIKGGANNVRLLELKDKAQYVCNSAFAVIRSDQTKIVPQYLAWYLQLDTTQQFLRSVQTGTTVQNLALKDLQNLEIPLLPLKDQLVIGRLALLENQRSQTLQDLVVKRKALLDQDLMNIVKKGGTND